MNAGERKRVLILGLDGAPWRLLDPWLAEGKLPNLARLIAGGARGPLRSSIPYVTAAAWVSCVTGKNPGKHGIFDFALRRPDGYDVDVVNSTRVRARPLWSILSDAGLRVGLVNVPVTYPPQPLNGALVTCMLTPSLQSRFTYPDSLREELLAQAPGYAIEPMTASSDRARTKAELAQNLARVVEARAQATRWLMERLGNWDFFMTVFTEPDRLMTYCWDDFDARHPQHDPASARRYGGLFLEHYTQLDAVVGRFVDEWQDRATIIVMSDHGFAGVHRFFYPNVWLYENGYLALKPSARPSLLARARSAARRLGVAHGAKKLATALFPAWGFTTGARSQDFLSMVDWSRTRAYWGADNGLSINLKGRQPQGIVEAGEYEALRSELIERWGDLRDPASGELAVEAVYRREEIYSGPHVEMSPDLRVVWKEYPEQGKTYFAAGELWSTAAWGAAGQTGDHTPVGVLIAGGRHVKGGGQVEGANIVDIAPTVLYALGQPIPADMDGRVLHELFAADMPAAAPQRVGAQATQLDAPTEAVAYSADEQKQIEERLRALGYLD